MTTAESPLSSVPNPEYYPARKIRLEPGKPQTINTDWALRDYISQDISGPVVADIEVAGTTLSLVDTRWQQHQVGAPYYITGPSILDPNEKAHWGIGFNKMVKIGRARDASGEIFMLPMAFSRRQFYVSYGRAGLLVTGTRTTNPTWLITPSGEAGRVLGADRRPNQERGAPMRLPNLRGKSPGEVPDPEVEHQMRTRHALDRAKNSEFYRPPDAEAPYGYYHDHPIIGRHSQSVENGVYLGGSQREAIVVDGGSPMMVEIYEMARSRLLQRMDGGETVSENDVMELIKDYVKEVMPYDAKKTKDIIRDFRQDQPINLSQFIREEAGVCRHQGLLAAYLTGRLIRDGYLDGTVAMERNESPDSSGVHAWGIYHSRRGQKVTYVIDPAQDFAGTKDEARRRHLWKYDLATDDMSYGPYGYSQVQ